MADPRKLEQFPNPAIEVSRRIKTRQRDRFKFLNPLQTMVELKKHYEVRVDAADVRVNLISRFDHLLRDSSPKIAGLSERELDELFGLIHSPTSAEPTISTCAEYITISLGDPIIKDQGDGWQTVEMPVLRSNHPLKPERAALTAKVDEALEEPGSTWDSVSPALQLIEFKEGAADGDQLLQYVSAAAPRRTELFDASVRFRTPVIY
jgi:hypothetical protein